MYRLAPLNGGFNRWLSSIFGKVIGYTWQKGAYTICYPAAANNGTVAGLTLAKRATARDE
jgi:hypothetical protein